MSRGPFNATFVTLIGRVGLEGRGQRVRPRPHDLRHLADGGVMRPVGLFCLLRAVPVVLLSA